ncbi:DUF4127 family protein [Deinococcus sp.]|uniref:DUF4127 family protein n=1 Tax=Deinococcus sp. TaxID=47478 RepID=UPI003CC61B11
MNKTVLLLPCDTRPPTLDHVAQLGRICGVRVLTPPLSLLNHLNEPGDVAALCAWLLTQAPKADAAVLSLETLCLGGMIPARRVSVPLAEALRPLDLLRDLKRRWPKLRLLASGVIVRVAHGNDPYEEKPYYGQYGDQLRAISERLDLLDLGQAVPDWEVVQAGVPAEILDDWLGTRERNHALHLEAAELLREGVLDALTLTLDDTTPVGLAARDRRGLEARLDSLGLWDRAEVYPGADEVACTLLARLVCGWAGRAARVWVRYPGSLSAQASLLFEDRCLGELVATQLRAAGCVPAESVQDADFVLAVNAPARAQAQLQPDFRTVDTPERHLPAFLDAIERDLEAGRQVVVADVAYPNGAERRFCDLLLQRGVVHRLSGYSAWNTAGNTLGTATAAGVCAWQQTDDPARAELARLEALLSRLIDDDLYQARVRPAVAAQLSAEFGGPPGPYDLGELRPRAEALLRQHLPPLARQLWQTHFAPHIAATLHLGEPSLAWPRLFTGVFPLRLEANQAEPAPDVSSDSAAQTRP